MMSFAQKCVLAEESGSYFKFVTFGLRFVCFVLHLLVGDCEVSNLSLFPAIWIWTKNKLKPINLIVVNHVGMLCWSITLLLKLLS